MDLIMAVYSSRFAAFFHFLRWRSRRWRSRELDRLRSREFERLRDFFLLECLLPRCLSRCRLSRCRWRSLSWRWLLDRLRDRDDVFVPRGDWSDFFEASVIGAGESTLAGLLFPLWKGESSCSWFASFSCFFFAERSNSTREINSVYGRGTFEYNSNMVRAMLSTSSVFASKSSYQWIGSVGKCNFNIRAARKMQAHAIVSGW